MASDENAPQKPPPLPPAADQPPQPPPLPFGVTPPSSFFPASAARPEPATREDKVRGEYEQKLAELERRLQQEREKLLVTQLKSQEEQATSAKVEVSLRELQDRLRRDRREQDQEEARVKLEKKAAELEARLAQERETWVATLKNQLSSRDSQEKEIETHFASRLQETERRWLEEKAGWQKMTLAKDEEIRVLRTLSEKLKGADSELSRTVADKKAFESRALAERAELEKRVTQLSRESAEAQARVSSSYEREKESLQLRADLQLSRQQASLVQERLERELGALRASSREREERLLADVERLQRDMTTIKQRLDAEHEAQLRVVKGEQESLLARQKDVAERAQTEVQQLRAIAGALERQAASGRAQVEELKRASAEWEKTQERYKAEFIVLQRKWVEREKEVRAEASAQAMQGLDAEKTRLKVLAQDELNQRAAKIAEQLRQENESDQRRFEGKLRADVEQELATRRHQLQTEYEAYHTQTDAEMSRLRRDLAQKDEGWSQRLLAKESELLSARARRRGDRPPDARGGGSPGRRAPRARRRERLLRRAGGGRTAAGHAQRGGAQARPGRGGGPAPGEGEDGARALELGAGRSGAGRSGGPRADAPAALAREPDGQDRAGRARAVGEDPRRPAPGARARATGAARGVRAAGRRARADRARGGGEAVRRGQGSARPARGGGSRGGRGRGARTRRLGSRGPRRRGARARQADRAGAARRRGRCPRARAGGQARGLPQGRGWRRGRGRGRQRVVAGRGVQEKVE